MNAASVRSIIPGKFPTDIGYSKFQHQLRNQKYVNVPKRVITHDKKIIISEYVYICLYVCFFVYFC
jgi:hypothetical protein